MAVWWRPGVSGLLDRRPAAGLLFFPDYVGDAIFHFVSAALFAVILLAHGGGYVPRPMKGDHGRFGYDVIVNGSGFGGTVSALS